MDVIGVAGSAICLVHCLAGPLLLLLAPMLPSVALSDQQFHRAMLYLVVPISSVAFLAGCGRHRDLATLALGASGLFLLYLAANHLHTTLGGSGERIFTVMASLVLGVAHLRNFRLCRAEDCPHRPEEAA